ncbi:ATP-binding protein [Desulfotignum balticum]|uniref:ATP-binding protein n=1 Tax=Desulfotignum balticum TaxID=115781 RepID=UPI000426AF9B|nr:ATP-binding protein [Desulfotignum balticum]
MPKVIDVAIKEIPNIESDRSVIDALELMQKNNKPALFLFDNGSFKGPISHINLAGYPSTRLLLDCPLDSFEFIDADQSITSIGEIIHNSANKNIVVRDFSGMPAGLIINSALLSILCDNGKKKCSSLFSSFCELKTQQQNMVNGSQHPAEKMALLEKMATIGQLSAGVIHDANNLLNVIMGNADLLRCEFSNESTNQKAQERIENILSYVSKCAHMLSTLNSLSKRSDRSEKTDVHKVLTNSLELVTPLLKAPNISVETRLAADESNIVCNKIIFSNILINLLLNACDAMGDDGHILITTSNADIKETYTNEFGFSIAPGFYLAISISDTGCGIPENYISKLFDPYFTTKNHGTGLGLTNVHHTIISMNGLVDVESKPGSGTTFKLLIPACTGDIN